MSRDLTLLLGAEPTEGLRYCRDWLGVTTAALRAEHLVPLKTGLMRNATIHPRLRFFFFPFKAHDLLAETVNKCPA